MDKFQGRGVSFYSFQLVLMSELFSRMSPSISCFTVNLRLVAMLGIVLAKLFYSLRIRTIQRHYELSSIHFLLAAIKADHLFYWSLF